MQTDHIKSVQNLHGIAMALAPALRDKWDFSDPGDDAKWAAMTYRCAAAFKAEADGRLMVAIKADQDAHAAALKAKADADEKARAAAEVSSIPLDNPELPAVTETK